MWLAGALARADACCWSVIVSLPLHLLAIYQLQAAETQALITHVRRPSVGAVVEGGDSGGEANRKSRADQSAHCAVGMSTGQVVQSQVAEVRRIGRFKGIAEAGGGAAGAKGSQNAQCAGQHWWRMGTPIAGPSLHSSAHMHVHSGARITARTARSPSPPGSP